MTAAVLTAENEELKAENKRLELRVKDLEKQLYGSKADRRRPEDENQTTFAELDQEASESEPPAAPATAPRRKERKGKKKGPKPLSPKLPRHEEWIEDPAVEELFCPITGELMKPVFEESIEVLARKPAIYYVRVLKRRVFAPSGGDAMAYSPWPASVMPRSRIDASVLLPLRRPPALLPAEPAADAPRRRAGPQHPLLARATGRGKARKCLPRGA